MRREIEGEEDDVRVGYTLLRLRYLYSLAAPPIDDETLAREDRIRAANLAFSIECDKCLALGFYPEQKGRATDKELSAILDRCDQYADELKERFGRPSADEDGLRFDD